MQTSAPTQKLDMVAHSRIPNVCVVEKGKSQGGDSSLDSH